MAEIRLEHVQKHYANGHHAVRDFSLDVADGEFVVFVGPSGCGKSTTLRLIAGLEDVSEGALRIGGRVVNHLQPAERDVAMVFQSYALYPHMSVRQNMGFALKLKGLAKAEVARRVDEASTLLQLDALLERRPRELSGGQRQRVALGRAIVREPAVFLMDEPLSNLDAKLRVEMRASIAALHRRLRVTTVYVTHDQVEAMTMGDRIVVMKDGVIQQVADPITLYNAPVNRFVGSFMGSPAMSFLQGRLAADAVRGDGFHLLLAPAVAQRLARHGEREAWIGLRPEGVGLVGHTAIVEAGNRVRGEVESVELLGAETLLTVRVNAASRIVARVAAQARVKAGETVDLLVDLGAAQVFDHASEINLGLQ